MEKRVKRTERHSSLTLLDAARSPSIEQLMAQVAEGKTVALTGLADSQAAFVASQLAQDQGLRVLLVTPNDIRATRAADDAAQLLTSGTAALTGGDLDLTRGVSSLDSAWRRLDTLTRAVRGEVRVLSASVEALMQRMGSADVFLRHVIRLKPGDVLPPSALLSRLVAMGYERVNMVEGKGQCAMRGAILDVYPPCAPNSLRIEYFDDEVDSIRAFDCMSQRSLEPVDEALIAPATEVLLPEEKAEDAAGRMRRALAASSQLAETPSLLENLPPLPDEADEEDAADTFDRVVAPAVRRQQLTATRQAELEKRANALMADAASVEQGLPFRRIRVWLTVLMEETETLLDWYRPQAIILCQPDALRERLQERMNGFAEELRAAIERGEAVPAQENLLMSWDELLGRLQSVPLITASGLTKGLAGIRPDSVISLESNAITGYHSQIKALAEDVGRWLGEGYTVALLSGGVARGQRLRDSLGELGVEAEFREDAVTLRRGAVTIVPITLSQGFVWPDARLAVCADTDIWGAGYRKAKGRKTSGERIAAFTDLHVGDYVVHEDHGIGIYQGTTRMTVEGAQRDYLLIQYADADRLYVPIDQLQRVQRYIGNPAQPPKLNSLGGDWKRQKRKAKEGLKKIAFSLVQLYANRTKTPGHAFSADTPWQREFEDQFPYELTPDQAQSVREITADMESDRNMDRLLIGDVGYGKTEVSLRAAFKAVMDGKQVAMLAPTTILAQQHYNTVRQRFASFPVTVEVLSRFRTAAEQKRVLADVAAGKVDILVGTHRILAKDVKFKDLGLLIVDEEQRFGVQHKEIIKNMKQQMDVLTLSATPIPRTLHMSMVGIRDMSVLESPPEDRLPVQTHVVEYSDGLVRDAILREISRGGQVYFLYNRVNTIERFYQRLRALVPEARIGIAHGQMKEHGLEDVMMDFYGGSYDVLLCTTIIESGLDVPTANTLIVFDAERFGLSQLYQLRGRVGRSSRQAYAYLTVRQDRLLSETAQQRLEAIREFTEFGAGFRIAMRDLEIRGAGNILGPEQHGHLETLGYEMYCKLIEETMAEAQGKTDRSELATRVDLHVDAFLPNDYIADEKQRMEMYKRIANLSSADDRADIIDELVDRFGEPPRTVETLLDVSQLRVACNRVGISQVSCKGAVMTMKMDPDFVPDGAALLAAMARTDRRLTLTPRGPTAMLFKGAWKNEREALTEAVKVMTKLNEKLDEVTGKESA